jgi:hypothetical protein
VRRTPGPSIEYGRFNPKIQLQAPNMALFQHVTARGRRSRVERSRPVQHASVSISITPDPLLLEKNVTAQTPTWQQQRHKGQFSNSF